jgi:hypothetical protein
MSWAAAIVVPGGGLGPLERHRDAMSLVTALRFG